MAENKEKNLKRNKILVMGDSNIDLVVSGLPHIPETGQEVFVDSIESHTGGSAANVAVSLAKLEVPVALHSFIGNDAFGDKIKRYFDNMSLSMEFIRTIAGARTGITIAVSNHADRFFISDMGANKFYDVLEFPEEKLQDFSHVHFSIYHSKLLDAYIEAAKRARKAGCTVSLDMGWTEFGNKENDFFRLLEQVDVFFPNINEARYLCGNASPKELAKELTAFVKGVVVITMGEAGALCFDGERFHSCAFTVNAKDAVGAGDAFSAGFIISYMQGANINDCLIRGCACGAIAVSSTGGGDASPSKSELEEFLANNSSVDAYASGL